MVRHWGAGSLAEHVVPAELNANIRLEPGKHELTAEEIAAASCTAFVNRYKAFAPSPAARTRLKAKTRTTRRPWAGNVNSKCEKNIKKYNQASRANSSRHSANTISEVFQPNISRG